MIEALRKLVADVLGVEASRISADTRRGHTENWDSLAHLSIITAVEERFGVRFGMAEIQNIESFDELAKALSARLAR